MPDSLPTPAPDDEQLNTAKQADPANVGALTRAQLTPEAAASPQGHDVPGHDHAPLLPKNPQSEANNAPNEPVRTSKENVRASGENVRASVEPIISSLDAADGGPRDLHAGHDHPPARFKPKTGAHAGHNHGDGGHNHGPAGANPYLLPGLSLALLLSGLALDYYEAGFFVGYVRLLWYGAAFLLVGWKVVRTAVLSLPTGNIFNEFLLMSLATLGAFALGEYPEGVAVMLFYTVGELFQDAAVNRAKRSIEALLQIQATETTVLLPDGTRAVRAPENVQVGDVIEVKPGEKVALDGTLLTARASFNTAALTGESVPQTKTRGDAVLAGMLNQETLVQLTVTAGYQDTQLARILALVQDAIGRKAKTQQFITRFARIYTPIVVGLAALLVVVPYFFGAETYVFRDWLYRALVFLVISCPCALVISIPLGYFGGIGAASRRGILFKGSNFLDLIRSLDTVVMDKTGTLTRGVFAVQEVVPAPGMAAADLLRLVGALEATSTHPIARAVVTHVGPLTPPPSVADVEEIAGHGLRGRVNGRTVLAGNARLLSKFSVPYPPAVDAVTDSVVVVAVDGQYAGYLTVADEIKPDAADAVRALQAQGVQTLVMLSGDKDVIVQRVAAQLGIAEAYGALLPEDKAAHVERLKRRPGAGVLAFVGDGVNDAPVVALADVGIAMGGLGADATIETADVVIQTDHPAKIATAMRIGAATHRVVWQNIGLAFGVKAVVLVLGAGGLATMWEAVFADVGVALLAILNAVRIQRMKF